jgi:hypothetical protein
MIIDPTESSGLAAALTPVVSQYLRNHAQSNYLCQLTVLDAVANVAAMVIATAPPTDVQYLRTWFVDSLEEALCGRA